MLRLSDGACLLVGPENVAVTCALVQRSPKHEQKVRKPVQVLACPVADVFAVAELDDLAFGPPADGATEVRQCRRARTARKYEFLERGKLAVEV